MKRVINKSDEVRRKNKSHKNKIANDDRPPRAPALDPPQFDEDAVADD